MASPAHDGPAIPRSPAKGSAAVERNYRGLRDERREHILPLVMDLADPSPALGWAHGDRASLTDRGPADVALALLILFRRR